MERILITGAAGFIGSHLAHQLVKMGYEVGIIKRNGTDIWRIKDILKDINVYNADLKDTNSVSQAISNFKPNIVYHLATYYAVDHCPQEIASMIDSNVLGTINLLEASKESRVNLFINTSTCSVYNSSMEKLKENSDINPSNLYSMTKIQAEQACCYYSEKYDLNLITLRLFPPYGPVDNSRKLIPFVIKSLYDKKAPNMTSGTQKWDFTFIDDIVEAYIKALSIENKNEHKIFNIGTGKAVSIREVVTRIKELMDSEIEPKWGAIEHRKGEIWYNCADRSKAHNILNWEPKIPALEKGLELTINWYINSFKGK